MSVKAKSTSAIMINITTRTKIISISIVGIVLLMLLRIHFAGKNKNLQKLVELMEDGRSSPYWKHCQGEPQFSLETDKNCVPCLVNTIGKIHLVTNFFPMIIAKRYSKVQRKGPVWGFIEEAEDMDEREVYQKRDRELLDVLQMNLNNNLIAAIHIIFNNDKIVDHIMNQRLRFACKIVFHKVRRNPTYEDSMIYIGKYLRHRLVVMANQDIYLGKGWNRLDFERVRKEKIMYALTRHGKKERYCTMPDSCSRMTEYVGSHDAFAFVLIQKPKPKDLAQLRHKYDELGIENIIINFFDKKLRYAVINPCFVLYVYHIHCANVHSKKRTRVNKYDNTGVAYFIDQLYTT